jgi:type I restriction enzyme S subunit
LGSVCKFLNGGTPSKAVPGYFEGDIPWITSADISGPIANFARSFITDDAVKNSAVNKVAAGAVLLVTRTWVGKVAVAANELCFSQDITALLPDDRKLEASYLVHFLRTKKEYFLGLARGATIQGITRNVVSDLAIPLPSLSEQRRIAAILDQADALRAKRREALAQLDILTQSIFIEMFGDFGTEYCRWNLVKFDQVVKDSRIGLVRGSQELGVENPYPYLRMNAIARDGSLQLEGASRAKATSEELASYSLRRGDFLFNTRNSRELVGKTALFNSDSLFLYNNNLLRIRFVEGVDSAYIFAAFKTKFIQNELEIRKSGTTNVFAIYYKDLRTLPLPLPPLELQTAFATRIQSVEALKARHREALQELDLLFASLQHRAFNSEL